MIYEKDMIEFFGLGGFIDLILQLSMELGIRGWSKVNNLHYGTFVEPGYFEDEDDE